MFTGEHPWAQLSQMQAIFKVCTPSSYFSQPLTMYSSDRLVLLQNQLSLRISRQRRMLSFSSPSTLITKSARLRQNLYNIHGSSYLRNNQSQHSSRKRLPLTEPLFYDFLLLFVCPIATRLLSSLYCRCAHRMILDNSISPTLTLFIFGQRLHSFITYHKFRVYYMVSSAGLPTFDPSNIKNPINSYNLTSYRINDPLPRHILFLSNLHTTTTIPE
jgi:hypothetical protein